MDLHYILYDTAAFSTVANTEFQLFKTAQGADATHSEAFTNMRASGILPNEEKMIIQKIHLIPDFNTVTADMHKLFLSTFIEIKVSDKTMLKAPAALFVSQAAYGGFYTQAAAANEYLVGLLGDGFDLKKEIPLPGGVSFYVRVVQGTALSTTCNLKVALEGIYTLAG